MKHYINVLSSSTSCCAVRNWMYCMRIIHGICFFVQLVSTTVNIFFFWFSKIFVKVENRNVSWRDINVLRSLNTKARQLQKTLRFVCLFVCLMDWLIAVCSLKTFHRTIIFIGQYALSFVINYQMTWCTFENLVKQLSMLRGIEFKGKPTLHNPGFSWECGRISSRFFQRCYLNATTLFFN